MTDREYTKLHENVATLLERTEAIPGMKAQMSDMREDITDIKIKLARILGWATGAAAVISIVWTTVWNWFKASK